MIIWIIIILMIILIIVLVGFKSINWGNRGNDKISNYTVGLKNSGYNREKMELPLWWDSETGLYKTKIRLSSNGEKDQEFIVIPDTGSNVLIITGPECDRCIPEMGVWDYSIGTGDKEIRKNIRYGGGQITEFIPWKANLVDFKNREIDFGVITSSKILGGPPQNVMGLQPHSEGFLSSLGHERSILFDFPNKKLQIGDLDLKIFPQRNSFSMVRYPHSTSSIQFIASKIENLYINDLLVPKNIQPLYATFDTGTTNTIVSNKFINYLQKNFPNGIKSAKIEFYTENSDSLNSGSRNLRNSNSENLRNPNSSNSKNSSIVSFTPPNQSTIHDRIDENTIMIGNRWLSQFIFGIIYDDMKLFLF